uniref:non-specific serine/threonine protein kinase n=1 Tax=Chenopodium quinoa TaxID=63459 RepID=A0A803MZ10_CHEQI
MKWVCQELGMKSILLLLLAVCLCLSIGVQAQITDPSEVSALKEIRSNLIDPMKNLSNWDRGDPCSSNWTGIVCYNRTLDDGYMHVQELELLNMNLSGSLSPKLGNLTYLKILLVNGNQLTGPLPEELGYLPNLNRIQIDQNKISGELPKSFANLNKTKHFHMNNNSISGQIPHELSRLPALVHFLLDNNNLSGHLPPEFSELPNLLIIQLDNNHFDGTTIPASYSNMSKLLKIDLSSNQLSGSIPSNKFSDNMTTIILSNNSLTGNIPVNFSRLPFIERLSLADNQLNGSVPGTIWENRTLTNGHKLIFLEGNPLCSRANLNLFCGSNQDGIESEIPKNIPVSCPSQACPPSYEYPPGHPESCVCAAPLIIEYRLKSPGFLRFGPYQNGFEEYLSSGLRLNLSQLDINSVTWQEGPRLKMSLKLFPDNSSHVFNSSEVRRIWRMFTGWQVPDNDTFGPYELLDFILLDPYKKGMSKSLNLLLY